MPSKVFEKGIEDEKIWIILTKQNLAHGMGYDVFNAFSSSRIR
jgi:hypothetical protein